MKKLSLILSAIILCVSMQFMPIVQAEGESYSIAACDGGLLLSGVTAKNAQVVLQVLYPGKTSEDILKDAGSAILYQGQMRTDDTGVYSFLFYPTATGAYPVRIGISGNEGHSTDTLNFYGADVFASEVLAKISAAKKSSDASAVGNIVESNFKRFFMSAELYEECSDKEAVYELLLYESDPASASELSEQLERAAVLVKISNTPDNELVKCIDDYAAVLGIDSLPAYETFKNSSEKVQKNIADTVKNGAFHTAEEILAEFPVIVVTTALRHAVLATDVKTILTTNAEEIGIRLQECDSLSTSMEVYAKLAGKTFADFSAIRVFFNDAVEAEKKGEKPQGGGSGVVSGGGGASFGGTPIGIAPATDVTAVRNENGGEQSENQPFSDLDSVSWAKDSIERLRDAGVVNGIGEGLFAPNASVSREEFVKFIVLGLGLELTEATDVDFRDVDRNAWYSSYVLSAASSGVVFGRDDGTFGVGDKITREDMAVMICRALSAKGISTAATGEPGFTDTAYISDYAAESVSFLNETGILRGLNNGSFEPQSFSTRAQVAVVICRTLDFLKGDE